MTKKNFHYMLGNLDVLVASFALTVLIVLTLLGVLMRYVFNQPITWMEEVQLFCMVWIVFASGGAAFRTKSHVAIEMVVDMLPKTTQKIFGVLIDSIVVLGILYLGYYGIGYVQLFLRSGRTTNMLGIPYWFIYGIVPLACIDMLASYFFTEYFMRSEPADGTVQEEAR
jgi:TRAP-type C4-dicarboxylate transport system permease small subunit